MYNECIDSLIVLEPTIYQLALVEIRIWTFNIAGINNYIAHSWLGNLFT